MWVKRRGGKRVEARSQQVQKVSDSPSITTYNAYGASTSGIHRTGRILEVEDSRATKRVRVETPPHPSSSHRADHDANLNLPFGEYGQPGSGSAGPTPDTNIPPSCDSPSFNTKEKAKSKKRTMGDKLSQAESWFPCLLRCLLQREAHPGIPGVCMECGQSPARFRCQECFGAKALCRPCLHQAHVYSPLHWVQEWTGEYFERRDLSELGFIHHLGHGGEPCPHLPSSPTPTTLVVTHVNGIHEAHVHFCHCQGRQETHEQLVLSDFIPASWTKARSVFTIEVLEDFHEDTLTSKKSAYDYMRKLRRRTSNSCAHEVQDRYREFMFVVRIWRYLKMYKRSGQCHGIEYPNRDKNLLTVPCFTCPWPGVNLPPDWESTPSHLRYIYRLFLGADGNHSLQKKTKPGDDSDYSLVGDRGFFNNPLKLKHFLQRFPKDTAKVIQTCSGFKVVRSQRTGKFRNLDISGVAAVTCIRHACFRARAVVDMPGGEQFPLVDLALAGALESAEKLYEWMLTYDVGCEYLANLLKRWKEWELPPHMLPIVEQLQVLLPQLHMLAHKEFCQCEYAVCYKRGTGHSNGETVETLWAEHNLVGLSTREMNGGARHDSLNDFFNSWNWYKTETRGKYIARKLQDKLELQTVQTRDLVSLSIEVGPDQAMEWLRLDIDDKAPTPATYSERRKNPKKSVFLLDDSDVPSKGKALEELLKQPITLTSTALSAVRTSGPSTIDKGPDPTAAKEARCLKLSEQEQTQSLILLKQGIDIESTQFELNNKVRRFREALLGKGTSPDKAPTLVSARSSLHMELASWRDKIVDAIPVLADVSVCCEEDEEEEDIDYEEDLDDPSLPQYGPELQPLGLPSDLEVEAMASESAVLYAALEMKLRVGHAYDLLAGVRMSVRKKAALVDEKDRNAHGTKDNLRSQELIRGVQNQTNFMATMYNHNFGKMETLQLALFSWAGEVQVALPSTLRRIDLAKDLQMSSLKASRNLGDSKRSLPWIFQVAAPQSASPDGQEAWEKETLRVDWFRAWAAKMRTDEEVNLLYAEARATRRGFSFAASLHRKHASALPNYASRGATAYALEKAAMFDRMSQDCWNKVEKAHEAYRKGMEEMKEDPLGLREIYLSTQKTFRMDENTLDYSLSLHPLILARSSPPEKGKWEKVLEKLCLFR